MNVMVKKQKHVLIHQIMCVFHSFLQRWHFLMISFIEIIPLVLKAFFKKTRYHSQKLEKQKLSLIIFTFQTVLE